MTLYSLIIVYLGFVVLGAFFAGAERRWPALPPVSVWRRDRLTDFGYWVFTPLVTGSLTRSATFGVIGFLALFAGYSPRGEEFLASSRMGLRWSAGTLSWWLQAILALLVADFVGYWSHRFRHTRAFWPFHAIHHSATQLDWLAAARMHPIDDLLDNVCVGLPILLLGFDLRLFAFLGPILILHTLLLHANVTWRFGPLRFVLVSPAMHRWHHAMELESHSRNFAGVFAFFDVMFGSFYLPDSRPQGFGTTDDQLPSRLGRQLVYPFMPRDMRAADYAKHDR